MSRYAFFGISNGRFEYVALIPPKIYVESTQRGTIWTKRITAGRFDYAAVIPPTTYVESFQRGGIWTRLLEWTMPRRPDGKPLSHKLEYGLLDFTEIRLLRIMPHNFDLVTPMICCEIVHASMVSRPEFVALSYCWGDPSMTTTIVVNNTAVQVTLNLNDALFALRSNGELLVWADALCINQNDLTERSYQVQRMGQIYSMAKKVVSWLGYGRSPYGRTQPGYNPWTQLYYHPSRAAPIRQLAGRLSEHPYWRRVWIIQEVSKASQIEVWYETWTMDLNELFKYILDSSPSAFISRSARNVLGSIRYFRGREGQSHYAVARMLLSESLLRSRMALATDPRDKVYALLSLTLDGSGVVPTPNYRQDVQDVFLETSRAMVVNQGQTAIMLLAKRNQTRTSWAPSWSNLHEDLAPWVRRCVLEHRQTLAITTTAVDDDSIQIHGLRLDSAGQLPRKPSTVKLELYRQKRKPFVYEDSLEIMLQLWDALTLGATGCRKSHLYSKGFCNQNPRRQKAIALASLLLCTTHVSVPALQTWFEHHKDVNLQQYTLEYWAESHLRNELRTQWKQLPMMSSRRRKEELKAICRGWKVDREAVALERGLRWMARYDMRVGLFQSGRLAVICGESRPGDCLCLLQNCSLAVVLRPKGFTPDRSTATWEFIGEVAWPNSDECDCTGQDCGRDTLNGGKIQGPVPMQTFFTIV